MNFYDVLAAEKWGGNIPTINFFDLLFAQSMGGGERWQTYEGTLPATINANGDSMKQYQIWGDTGGVGDRTVNLFDYTAITSTGGKYLTSDGNIINSDEWSFTNYIPVDGDVFTVGKIGGNLPSICLYDENKQFISGTAYNSGGSSSKAYTTVTGQNAKYARFSYYSAISPNRDDLSKIMLTEGTTAPASFVPYGYKIDMGVKSGNLLSFDVLMNAPSGKLSNVSFPHVLELTLKPYTTYTAVSDGAGSETGTADNNRSIYIDGANAQTCVFSEHPITVQTDADGVIKIGILSERPNAQQYINGTAHVWLVEGELPLPYQPYSNTVTPIYIGDDPLEKDEYVDYGAQKVYRMINGTLTPTNPPVPLPALPSCEGATIVDYAGSGTAPEKVYFEYQGGKQP